MEKKIKNLCFRLTETERSYFDKIAEEMNLPPGTLACAIIKQYMKDHKSHGEQLAWPPKFYTRADLSSNEIDKIQKNADRDSA